LKDLMDILAVGAHPDDAEVGCGGVLIMAADVGRRVAVADLTSGEAATRGSAPEREEERRAASRLMGLCARPCLGLPDAALGTDPAHRMAVVRLIRDLRPAVVLAPYTEDRHPDHAAAGRLVREACFLAGIAKVGEGSPHSPNHVYHYLLHHPFQPSFVIDVSGVWDRKMEAIRAHRSQFGPPAGDDQAAARSHRFLEVVEARATFYGAMIGAGRGEPFFGPGPVAVRMLPGLEEHGGPPPYRTYP
jgi:bacillithiol biosynthesis deacetylase BshB1